MKKNKLREIFSSRRVAKVFSIVLAIFLFTTFYSEWRTNSYIQKNEINNKLNYKYMVQNASRLNVCYVEKPNIDYCMAVLKILSSQIHQADFNTHNLVDMWFLTYMKLASNRLTYLPKEHDAIVMITFNEELLTGDINRFLPSNPDNIKKFSQELTAVFRTKIQIELSAYSDNKTPTLNNKM